MYVSIISVNYNGKHLLDKFLKSIENLNYPKNMYETIIVDNGSNDGSVMKIKGKYPWVKLILSEKNLGFGAGNNLGIKKAKGEFCFLVNNDTVLNENVVSEAIKTYNYFSKRTKIGAITCKLILVDSYLPLKIKDGSFKDYGFSREMNPVNAMPYIIPHETSKYYFENVFIPFKNKRCKSMKLKMNLSSIGRIRFSIKLNNTFIYQDLFKNEQKAVDIKLPYKQVVKNTVNLMQNAGNFYFRDGFGRDRGVKIINKRQYYEVDSGQYDKAEVVPGFCGAGVLLNKNCLNEIGLFDENFFMYYEDGDLSFRMKEAGWKVIYSPKSVIRHIHAASSKEWSDFFIFNVEKSRLLMLSKHWPRILAINQFVKYILFDMIGVPIRLLYKDNPWKAFRRLMIRLKVFVSVLPLFIINLLRISRLNRSFVKTLL